MSNFNEKENIQKEIFELRKEYAGKFEELRKEYFEKLKGIVPEKRMPGFIMKDDFAPEEFFKSFPKPPFMMDDDELEEFKNKRKEFFEKVEKNDPIRMFFKMKESKEDED